MTRVWINGKDSVEVTDAEGTGAVHLTIDDKEIAVSGGQTILEAVQRMPGIGNIPYLCYHTAVKPYGACRICTVEVSEDNGSNFRLVAACLYPVRSGQVVKTDTERIRRLRKGILELLLARCSGVKKVQELAEEYGVKEPRFTGENQECTLCGLCVRACEEIIGKSAISLVNRGVHREVAAPFYVYELADTACIGCGDCAFVCPNGAIRIGADGKPVLPKVKASQAEAEAMTQQRKE